MYIYKYSICIYHLPAQSCPASQAPRTAPPCRSLCERPSPSAQALLPLWPLRGRRGPGGPKIRGDDGGSGSSKQRLAVLLPGLFRLW